MKRTTTILLTLLVLMLGAVPASAYEYSAEAMILYEPRSGTVLYEKNADARLPIASTTKIMTALVVLENCAPDEPVNVTAAHAAVEGSSMYLRPGGEYSVDDLLYGLMLASGNDAALALAEHTAGSVEAFAALMNEKCASLGLKNTHFDNPHGLDSETHYSSARDMACITACAMEREDFCRYFATERKCVRGITYVNHNKLLRSCEGCLGGKTGYTRSAGRSLVSCVEQDGMRLICVTLRDPCDWDDHQHCYDAAFADYYYVPMPEERWRSIAVLSGADEQVALRCSAGGLVVPKDAVVTLDVRLPRFVFAPVSAGAELGSVTVAVDGETVYTAPIYSERTVVLNEGELLSPWERFGRRWKAMCAAGFVQKTVWSA